MFLFYPAAMPVGGEFYICPRIHELIRLLSCGMRDLMVVDGEFVLMLRWASDISRDNVSANDMI
jgi:hypothetical protein